MKAGRFGAALSALALLSACGGGGGGGSPSPSPGPISGPAPSPSPSPSPTPTAGCSLRERQNWAAAQLREWYLFPETLPASFDPTPFNTVQDYVDSLTATARSQRRDRFFTFVTSIQEENAFFSSGQTAGFGIRLSTDAAAGRVFVVEAFEGAPGLAAGIDRGTEILAVGTSEANLRPVTEIVAAEGSISPALGPSTAGTTRVLRIADASGTRTVTVTKTDFSIPPVSPRYGARIIDDAGRRIGYLNLRTFISTADPQLRQAFEGFRTQGITQVIIDFRYNGGGLVSTAELMGDLLGANRSRQEVFSFTTFRPEKSQNNDTRFFDPKPQSIGATKIAFIGTRGTASASELVINSFIPYLGTNAGLIGTNTFGKPVGQIALDRPACDDRLRVVAFKTENAARQGDYYDGLATVMQATCQAPDDPSRQLGDPSEGSIRTALDYLAGRPCTRIASGGITGQSVREGQRELIAPDRPNAAQREVPGFF
ncbi:MAG TPA: S41 family peptidase [Allosphingosinicella sp.]|jgi:C-terminal processing protease CtpA/Prc|uniref:S41 family peptidase n=1 Tax=Allosphingosinicella sp. TaxID=2823234 RepID=UPI002F2ADFBD